MVVLRWWTSSLLLAALGISAAQKPKHIIFIMVDDLGWNDVSYHNTSDLSSPTIDSLAKAGVRLERYYTHNLCSPSRTAFLSGRFAHSIGMQGFVILNGAAVDLPRNVSTVADRLRKGGYHTAAFGKWDAGMTTWDFTPTCRGFDHFYGFYGPAQDHYTHSSGGLDLRDDFAAVHDKGGVYSTHLYTQKTQEWLTDVVREQKASKTFVYLAYQAMHAPVEAPEEYVNRCGHVTETNKRRTYCGMMLALDEGINNVTTTYKDLGIWNDTLLVLAADNGGHVGSSGNNWPLRGEKATNYEGGLRGVSFLHWPQLPAELRGTESHQVVHVADWLPTFVEGVAGLSLSDDGYRWPIDGVNQWESLTVANKKPARDGLGLVHEIGGDNHIHQEAYLEGNYKLIRNITSIYFNGKYHCDDKECPYGWMPPPGQGAIVPPPATENKTALVQGGIWLFDVFADPLEKKDLTALLPDVVERLGAALDKRKARNIPQLICPVDPKSKPSLFDGVWTPWRGSRTPTCSAGGDDTDCTSSDASPVGHLDGIKISQVCQVTGWCSGPHFSGSALDARILMDGQLIANVTASEPRETAGNHGFLASVDCAAFKAGKHRLEVDCYFPGTGTWFQLTHSPMCSDSGKVVSCNNLWSSALLV